MKKKFEKLWQISKIDKQEKWKVWGVEIMKIMFIVWGVEIMKIFKHA